MKFGDFSVANVKSFLGFLGFKPVGTAKMGEKGGFGIWKFISLGRSSLFWNCAEEGRDGAFIFFLQEHPQTSPGRRKIQSN